MLCFQCSVTFNNLASFYDDQRTTLTSGQLKINSAIQRTCYTPRWYKGWCCGHRETFYTVNPPTVPNANWVNPFPLPFMAPPFSLHHRSLGSECSVVQKSGGWSRRALLVRRHSGPCVWGADVSRVLLFEAFRRGRTTCWYFRRDVSRADRGRCATWKGLGGELCACITRMSLLFVCLVVCCKCWIRLVPLEEARSNGQCVSSFCSLVSVARWASGLHAVVVFGKGDGCVTRVSGCF